MVGNGGSGGALWLDSRRSEKVLPLLELGLQVWPDDLPLNLFSAEALAAHGKTEQGLEQIRDYGSAVFWSFDRKKYQNTNWWPKTASAEVAPKLTIRTANTVRKIARL